MLDALLPISHDLFDFPLATHEFIKHWFKRTQFSICYCSEQSNQTVDENCFDRLAFIATASFCLTNCQMLTSEPLIEVTVRLVTWIMRTSIAQRLNNYLRLLLKREWATRIATRWWKQNVFFRLARPAIERNRFRVYDHIEFCLRVHFASGFVSC